MSVWQRPQTVERCQRFAPHLIRLPSGKAWIDYDEEGYATERLAALKQLIADRGLRREQVGRDLVWKWDRFPGFEWALEWEARQ